MSPRGWQLLGLRNVIGQPKELRTESIMAGQLSEEVHPYAVRTNCAPTVHPLLFFNHLKQGERSQIDMMHKSLDSHIQPIACSAHRQFGISRDPRRPK